ncbi:hypothetical protein F5884DRAFT_104391 [Xylogone sp. PMI_703]|nr:hypothetical protein F5884DRAFT_104391 [Xylogone sp. PMI_703]
MASGSSNNADELINEIVAGLVEQFLNEFGMLIQSLAAGTTQDRSLHGTKIPESVDDYREYTWRFIRKNLASFYKEDDPFVEELVQRAAAQAKEFTVEYDLEPTVTPKLIIMALYDFVVLCDDSGSMRKGNRIKAQADTCFRVAQIATFLQPQGISLRFLNSKYDGDFNLLVDENDIKSKMGKVEYGGPTKLGTILETKIVEPLVIGKAKTGNLKKPLIIAIITDGCPNNEDVNSFQETVQNCKDKLSKLQREPAGAIFLISRVGNDPLAETFLKNLQKNKDLDEMVYCCLDQLDNEREIFLRAGKDRQYSSYLVKLFEAALDSQTK